MRPLVVMPIVRGQTYQETMDAMYALEWDDELDLLQLVGGDDPETPTDNVVRKYNVARDVVLKSGYDALLTYESDIIAPPDGLKRLAAVDADVVYGLYIWRHGPSWWNAYSVIEEKRGVSFSKDLKRATTSWGKVVKVAGIGNGFTLIRRHVLERFPFAKSKILKHCCDWRLAIDCQEAGFVQKCDLGVICGHIRKEPVPGVIWPDITQRGFYRIEEVGPMPTDLRTNGLEYLSDMEGKMKVRLLHRAHLGKGVVMYPGKVVDLPKDQARQLIWNGIAEEVKKKRKKPAEDKALRASEDKGARNEGESS